MTVNSKNILGIEYVSADNKNRIKLSDNFVTSHGADLVESILKEEIPTKIPLTEETDAKTFKATFQKVSIEEARLYIEKAKEDQRKKATEK